MGDSDDDFFGDMGAVMAACEQAERILEPNKVDDISAVKTAALGQMAVDGAVETIEATPQSQSGRKRESEQEEGREHDRKANDDRGDDVTPDVGVSPRTHAPSSPSCSSNTTMGPMNPSYKPSRQRIVHTCVMRRSDLLMSLMSSADGSM
eukprot:m.321474 g.321474  ORF g.321474 m.321474 type:complete len:150 (-) comp27593_c1_seq7:11991-12440(-)